MSNVKGWFAGLSQAAKIAVVSASLVVVLGASAVVNASSCNDPIKFTTYTTTEAVDFHINETKDPSMNAGEVKIQNPGVKGTNQVTYKVGEKCEKQVSKVATKTVIKKEPVAQEQSFGSKEVSTETVDVSTPFSNQDVLDSNMNKGTSKVVQAGVDGLKKVTYQVIKVDGAEQSRTPIGEDVIKSPVEQITHIGTRTCDPNYTGCVPIAPDVDCGGGSGNGPAYFYGTARVIGYDIYGLDRDGDGYACE
jgi:uncharacterized protein YabE (DUF348 family)